MFKIRKGLLAILLLLFFWSGWLNTPNLDRFRHDGGHPDVVHVSDQRRTHILYGDETGGGHRHGLGKACKSEFPVDWDDARIITTVKRVAANDNLDWKKENFGLYTAEEMVDGVKVKVVLNKEKASVITAYPVNVTRNPCPVSNDNRKLND